MTTTSNEVPPKLNKSKRYSVWVRLVKLCTKFADLENNKQGPVLVNSLHDKALPNIFELSNKYHIIKVLIASYLN